MAGDLYSTPQWRRTRQLILARDNHTCQIQRAGCTLKATAVDHIIPVKDLPPNHPYLLDPHNLRASCTACNTSRRNSPGPHSAPSRNW